jgi:RNA polymerase sigma-70 factor (ECF subfamily)
MEAAALEAIFLAAQRAWPEIAVERARFGRFLDERPGSGLHYDDLYLACACLDGDAAALRAFDALLEQVGKKLRRLAGGDDILADAKQVVRQLVIARSDRPAPIAEYSGRGELGGWLRIALGRELVRSSKRALKEPQAGDDELAALHNADDDPETQYLKTHYREEFKQAFAAAIGGLDAGERRALRYSIVEGLGIDEVAKLDGVHRSTAARQVARARERLSEETRRILREKLAVESTELQSILRLIDSQLDVSVRRLLK